MRNLSEKYRALVWISLLLTAGFLTTGIAAYRVSRDALQRDLVEQALPMASDLLHAEIRTQVARPALLASMIASDSFVRDWMASAEDDADSIARYLADIQRKYGAVDVFLVSDRTRSYYTSQGVSRIGQEGGGNDTWFFRARDMRQPFATEIAIDRDNGNAMTIIINHRMDGMNGDFLGIAGVGLRMNGLQALVASHEAHAGRRIYLVDGQRKIVLAGSTFSDTNKSIDQLPGMGEIAAQLLHRDVRPVIIDSRHDGSHLYVSGRFMPELGWHLIVAQDATVAAQPAWNAFVLTLAIGAGVSLLVLALTFLIVRRYEQRLALMAGSDTLTGLLNRQAFDIVFRQAMLEAERGSRPYSCIVFDIDCFKQVNDRYGHSTGDEVLRTISRIARTMLRESDVITRWGGEEFIVLLKECPQEQAVAVAEKLRHAIDQHDFSPAVADGRITISLGVAQHAAGETAMRFLQRADEALSRAKSNGGNRLQVARTGAVEGSTMEE